MSGSASKLIKDCVVIGAALFAMFFGAGNMIFPPYLGLQAGVEWFVAFLGYYAADVGLAVVAMLALIRTGGSEGLLRPLGRVWGGGLMCAIMLCLGPIISIPRTA
ncbi:MAG: branched-chain amino acid transport system II carrier protein, partial [Clostridium sp.]|nr:branched-chain amino acid transport system II carrier protein [Clostridium sp.]